MRARALFLLSLAAIAACSKPEVPAAPAVEAPSASTRAPEVAAEKVAPETAPAPAAQAITNAEAQALLTAWLNAQNQGDFAAYSALYAQRFTGVRRSAERTVRLPRDAWLKDRQRMFREPHHVAAEHQVMSFPAGMAKLHFTQAWSSASYADRGDKELLITREGDTLRIIYEEMLFSEPGAAPSNAASSQSYFVLQADSPYAYLGDGVPGRPHGADLKRTGTIATASIGAADVPSKIATQVGKRVQALTRDGKSCGATLGALKYVISVVTYEALGAMEDPEAPPMSETEIVEGMWQLASHVPIGAQIVLDAGSACDLKQVVWVRASEAPISVGTPIDPAPYREAALAAMHAHRKYKAIQRKYDSFYDGADNGPWEGTADVALQAFRLGSRTLVSVAMPNPPCTAFAGSLWGLFEVTGDDAKLKPLWLKDDAPTSVTLMFDDDGDGMPEWLTQTWETQEQRASSGGVLRKERGDVFVCGC